jgi:hypothetical protein
MGGAEAGGPVPGDRPRVVLVAATPDRVELEVGCVRMIFAVHAADDERTCYVDSSEGSVTLVELPPPAHQVPDQRGAAPQRPAQAGGHHAAAQSQDRQGT